MHLTKTSNISKCSHPVGILLVGLLIAQVIATAQVYQSNINLHATISAANAAGYLSIPNEQVMHSLKKFYTAFYGGFFFTFTIGAGLTLGSTAAALMWIRLFLRRRSILFLLLAVWLTLLVIVNSNGLSIMPTLYFLLIIPVAFLLTVKRESGMTSQAGRLLQIAHFLPLPLLALLWLTQLDGTMFLDLRDHLLLSNTYGRKVSQFYYAYTLYPAEAFKALKQKTIKTSHIVNAQTPLIEQKIGNILLADDYLLLSNTSQVDLVIHQKDDQLEFQADKRRIFQVPLNRFWGDSRDVLQKFSAECDRNAMFRSSTFLSLLIGFPVSIYLVIHAILQYLGRSVLSPSTSALMASIICLLIGITALVFFQSHRSRNVRITDIADALKSEHWPKRVAAIKLIEQKQLEIANYPGFADLLSKPTLPEKYWLVRALAYSRRPETFKILLDLLKDVNLNIRTMALYALGLRRDRQAVKPIIAKIEKSTSWYEQMYAYRALRSIGWKQTRSH